MRIVLSDFQDQLVRGLSHRMNNILSLFHGYLGLLMDDRKLDTITREGLKKIQEGARAATDLMDRTNAISRPAVSIRRPVNLGDFFRQIAPTIKGLLRPKVEVMVECADDVAPIHVDPSRLKLAVVELVRNACEAASSKVTISAAVSQEAVQAELFPGMLPPPQGHCVRIAVTDDGSGIPKADAVRIYEPFFSTKRSAQAAGLGLSVALGCAQQFGGSLTHRSRRGETTFEMIIPAQIPDELSAVA